jgi:hypothetical protein
MPLAFVSHLLHRKYVKCHILPFTTSLVIISSSRYFLYFFICVSNALFGQYRYTANQFEVN